MSDRKRLTRIFKMHGLSLQASALDTLLDVVQREAEVGRNKADVNNVIFNIIDEIKDRRIQGGNGSGGRSSSVGNIVTSALLEDVVADFRRDAKDVSDDAVQLLDAFHMPRLDFDRMRKNFSLVPSGKEERTLYGEAVAKVDMFNQRYALIQQRILRQDIFQPKLVTNRLGRSAQNNGGTHTITPVESLLGRSGRRFLLGMIVQVEEGKYYLEDHTAQVPLNFSEASLLTDGFVTENSVVLIEGEAIDGILHVHNMGSPIVENRLDSIKAIGLQNSDVFNSIGSLFEYEKLREQEIEHGEDGMFVVLSDVYLDSPAVIEKIERMLEGYSDFSPLPIFVFMGNFTSKPLSSASEGTKAMISYFEDLANVICKFPNVANEGRFVFIPGPNDPGITGVLPRGPIPNYFTSALRSKVKNVMLASNPCRMRFFTKEIVFFRDNLVSKMRRSCLIEPRQDSNGQLSSHAIKTVLDQGHLSPLPLSTSPIYWQHDHALRLYPFPDALICGDRVEQYYETYEECDAINPGPFSNGFNFVVYCPVAEVSGSQTKSDVELCEVP
eukprot:CAMPEP_0201731208 /NCGR_PEP_ID=MMETSP0593-20130828/24908_1 /ASSEMBLY_ACC=CAM_ASM_000672 /TAXON_ID=267983 /ORGANISM="Skeletonema japonicum, Strain CCMP2506" /LENGTH=553 /DNA_ID=CAMNT_0048223925 /DNA_START=88 /DNA_END=1749 /DNA_ORIENTATION=-